jgi:hypothetical protein
VRSDCGGSQTCRLLEKTARLPSFQIRSAGDLNNALLWIAPGSKVTISFRRYPDFVCRSLFSKDSYTPYDELPLSSDTGVAGSVELTLQ